MKKFLLLLLAMMVVPAFASAEDVCVFKDKALKGKVKIVDYGADIKVKQVDYGEDLKVKAVEYGADSCGKWQFVEYGEDYIKVKLEGRRGDSGSSCVVKGKMMKGKVKIVEYGEDVKVKRVDYGESIRVKRVDYGADSCGEWQIVDYGEDFKIKLVDYGEDVKVKFVDYNPGT